MSFKFGTSIYLTNVEREFGRYDDGVVASSGTDPWLPITYSSAVGRHGDKIQFNSVSGSKLCIKLGDQSISCALTFQTGYRVIQRWCLAEVVRYHANACLRYSP